MPDTYSTYEAKARFSEILRRVREGKTVRVSYRGDLVAEIRPIQKNGLSFEDRLRELRDRGALVPSGPRCGELRPVAHKPGALERFLAERNA